MSAARPPASLTLTSIVSRTSGLCNWHVQRRYLYHPGMRHNSGDKSYENAMEIIEARRRQTRPKQSALRSSSERGNRTPDLRGSPAITGMREWLTKLGHSAQGLNRLNVIHVAGTKGKGSTCAFTEAFLRAHGARTGFPKKTGLYTSPHLLVPEERIRINSRPVSPHVFARYFFEVLKCLPQLVEPYDPSKDPVERGPRYLQLFALLAFHTFVREGVDVAIFETHCGGEYDATNIVEAPLVTAVTTLGMDHLDMLGPTIENIAWHKGGIFKPGSIALSAPQDIAPAAVLEQRSAEKGVKVRFVEIDERLPLNATLLQPDVQKTNASLAIAAARAYLDQKAPADNKAMTREDVTAAIQSFEWPGRFQIIRDGPRTWFLDSAHNDMSVQVAAEWFSKAAGGISTHVPQVLIFSHINELRDSAALLKTLGNALVRENAKVEHVIFSTYDESSATKSHSAPTSPELFCEVWQSISPDSKMWNEPTIQGAIALAGTLHPEGTKILITGSQHLVGPALRLLEWRSSTNGVRSEEVVVASDATPR